MCIQSVSECAAALFYGQTIACFQGQRIACFNQLLRWCCASSIAACGGFKATSVNGVGNIACGYQFACVCASRNGYFACICTCGGCSQGYSVHAYFVWVCCAAITCYGYWAVIGSLNFGFGGIQLCHINGIGVVHTFGYITQFNAFAWVAAYQFNAVAWCAAVVACVIHIAQWGVEFHFGYAIGAGYIGYCTLSINKVDGIAVSNKVFGYAIALYVKACVQHIVYSSGIIAFACEIATAVIGWVSCCSCSISQIAFHVCQGGWG